MLIKGEDQYRDSGTSYECARPGSPPHESIASAASLTLVRRSDTGDPGMGHWSPANFVRSVSLSIHMRSAEFRRELRLEAAACLFEVGFRPRHVSQQ